MNTVHIVSCIFPSDVFTKEKLGLLSTPYLLSCRALYVATVFSRIVWNLAVTVFIESIKSSFSSLIEVGLIEELKESFIFPKRVFTSERESTKLFTKFLK